MASGKRKPQPGDLIEINRGIYQHWALYLDQGYVIHVTAEDEGISPLPAEAKTIATKTAKVKKQLLEYVAGTDDWKVNNKYDRSYTPLPVKEIMERAKSYLDNEVSYDLLSKNCEHFVTMLRYGVEDCSQVRRAVRRGTSLANKAITAVAVGGVAVAATAAGAGTLGVAAAAAGAAVADRALKAFFSWALGNKRKSN